MAIDTTRRDYGIDLLRLLAMGLIVLHHLLLHGGLTWAFSDFTVSGMVIHLINAFTRCAVNVYALISGYVMVQSKFRPSRLFSLWLQVVFYGLMGVLVLPLMGQSIQPAHWISAVLPIAHDNYWYFTCYFVTFCLSPFLNQLLKNQSKRQTCLMLMSLILLFSLLPVLMLTDRFQLNGGYHPLWLIIMYLMGGAMRLHGFRWFSSWKTALAAAFGCVLLGWGFRLIVLALGAKHLELFLLDYTSPCMLVCAVAVFSLFSGRTLPAWLIKMTAVLSPLTFGVYLIHDNPLVREHLLKMRMIGLAGLNPVLMLGGLFALWAGVYAVCLLIEWLRGRLFTAIRVPALCEALEKQLFSCAQRVFPKADA